jgi:hypothetical protein
MVIAEDEIVDRFQLKSVIVPVKIRIQEPKGVFELFSGLKSPAGHPTAIAHHE